MRGEVRHDTESLREGAKQFDRLGDTLYEAYSGGADPYHVPDTAWANPGGGAKAAYLDLRSRIDSLVDSGRLTMGLVGAAIRKAADDYDAERERQQNTVERIDVDGEQGIYHDRERENRNRREFGQRIGETLHSLGEEVGDQIVEQGRNVTEIWTGDGVPDPIDTTQARRDANEAWEKLGPVLGFVRAQGAMFDAATRETARKFEQLDKWQSTFHEISKASGEWGEFAKRLTLVSADLNSATAAARRSWSGPASNELGLYVTGDLSPKIPLLSNYAVQISSALATLYAAYSSFWSALRNAVITGFAGLAGSALTGAIAGPVAVGVMAASITTFVGFIGNLLVALMTAEESAGKALAQLEQVSLDGFPNNTWPRPGRALNDGSTRDGDGSDWKSK